jgi:hypothetical protein
VLRQAVDEEGADRLEILASLVGRKPLEAIGHRADPLELGREVTVFLAEPLSDIGRGWTTNRAASPAECAQGVEDRRDVDRLLHDRSRHRSEQTERPEEHEPERQPHAHQHALHGDPAGTLGDRDRFHQSVEAVDHEHDVGCLR